MRTPLVILTALALVAFLPASAQAQQSSALVISLSVPEETVPEDGFLVYEGVATFTADYTAAISLMGIPVSYTVTDQPEWVSVTISPATDIFPLPSAPPPGFAYTVTKSFTVVVTLAHDLKTDASGVIEITGVTSPGTLGRSAEGKANAPIVYDAPDVPCDEAHSAELLALARQAADAYAKEQGGVGASAPAAPPAEEGLSVQNTAARPLALPWIALVGFAAVGAGVGLLLRRKLAR